MVAARRRELDVHVSLPELEDLWGMQVMMTEDNIIITTVRQLPDHGDQILMLGAIVQFRSSRVAGDDPNILNGQVTRDLTKRERDSVAPLGAPSRTYRSFVTNRMRYHDVAART